PCTDRPRVEGDRAPEAPGDPLRGHRRARARRRVRRRRGARRGGAGAGAAGARDRGPLRRLRRAPAPRDRAAAARGGDADAAGFRLRRGARALERDPREARADPAGRSRPGFPDRRHDAGGDLAAADSFEEAAAADRLGLARCAALEAPARRHEMETSMTRLTSLCAALLMLAACGGDLEPRGPIGGATGTELADRQVINIGNGADPHTLDPHRAQGVPESNIGRDLFEGLIAEAPNGDLIPGVAESWEVSDDGKTYTFRLRENARWSNGDPVTAGDFVFGM